MDKIPTTILYWYKRNGKDAENIIDAIKEAITAYVWRYGVYPHHAIVRIEERGKGKFPIKVKKVHKGVPPGHFMLCPTSRLPKVLRTDRTPSL